jgi:DNA-binding response OmpR family regulator
MSGSVHGAALCQGVDYLAKPFALAELDSRVRSLLGRMSD